jgi:hypothetical protein
MPILTSAAQTCSSRGMEQERAAASVGAYTVGSAHMSLHKMYIECTHIIHANEKSQEELLMRGDAGVIVGALLPRHTCAILNSHAWVHGEKWRLQCMCTKLQLIFGLVSVDAASSSLNLRLQRFNSATQPC